jgi:transcriptional regulator with XRE-family HTH domain
MQTQHLPVCSQLQCLAVKLSECVKAWLDHTGRRQTDIAKRAKLPLSMFNGIAKGHNPNPRWDTLEKVAAGFGITVIQLLEGPRAEPASDLSGQTRTGPSESHGDSGGTHDATARALAAARERGRQDALAELKGVAEAFADEIARVSGDESVVAPSRATERRRVRGKRG